MSKSPDAFRTIREVADWLGVAAHVLRFWESKFTQIRPVKARGWAAVLPACRHGTRGRDQGVAA
jgi:hypothetical protein